MHSALCVPQFMAIDFDWNRRDNNNICKKGQLIGLFSSGQHYMFRYSTIQAIFINCLFRKYLIQFAYPGQRAILANVGFELCACIISGCHVCSWLTIVWPKMPKISAQRQRSTFNVQRLLVVRVSSRYVVISQLPSCSGNLWFM